VLDLFIVLMVFLIVVVVAAFLRHESRQRTPFWDPFEARKSVSRRVGDLLSMAAFPEMLRRDRERWGMRECQAAWRFGASLPEYRELEAGTRSPTFETWGRICKLYGWPQTLINR